MALGYQITKNLVPFVAFIQIYLSFAWATVTCNLYQIFVIARIRGHTNAGGVSLEQCRETRRRPREFRRQEREELILAGLAFPLAMAIELANEMKRADSLLCAAVPLTRAGTIVYAEHLLRNYNFGKSLLAALNRELSEESA